jgi:NADPH2:quinone reductase
MKAAVIYEAGQSPRYADFPDPVPAENEMLVRVKAAGLHPIVKGLASGAHYASSGALPAICGIDGVGVLEDGRRIYFGALRPPYGTMAELAVTPRGWALPLPDALDDITAAALFNPAVSSWLPLTWRAKLAPGESVLIMGATGVGGKLAVQAARHLGAGRVVAAGRNPAVLESLLELGADAVIQLDRPDAALKEAFAREAGDTGYNVIIDYVWGHPTEVLLETLTAHGEFSSLGKTGRTRLVEVGAMAGPKISLPAEVLRSTQIELYGSGAGSVPVSVIQESFPTIIELAASGKLRIDTEAMPLANITEAWQRSTSEGRRIVIVP